MLDHEITKNTQVRIMSDVHAGKGSTIGTTIKLPEKFEDWKVSPNVVGVFIVTEEKIESYYKINLEYKERVLKTTIQITKEKVCII